VLQYGSGSPGASDLRFALPFLVGLSHGFLFTLAREEADLRSISYITIAAFEAAPALAGDWGKGRIAKPEPRQRKFRLNLNIINFPSAAASR
jgi:hypothetical protein